MCSVDNGAAGCRSPSAVKYISKSVSWVNESHMRVRWRNNFCSARASTAPMAMVWPWPPPLVCYLATLCEYSHCKYPSAVNT